MDDDSGYFFFQSPWKNIFLWHFMEVEREAIIVSPVIDLDILKKLQSILIAGAEKKLRIRMLLRFSESDIFTRGIDPETLAILALFLREPNSRIEIRFLPNIAMTSIVLDSKKAILATGDLSSESLLEEVNYGQMMTGKDLVGAFKEDLQELWKAAGETNVDEMISYMDRLKDRIELRHELIFEDQEKGIEFNDDDFISLGKAIKPLGKDRAEPHLDETRKIIKELLLRARDAADDDNSQTALFYLEEGLALDAVNSDLLMEKGKILFEIEKDIDGALNCFDKVLDKDDDNRDAWAYSGMCHHDRGELEDALYSYDQATDIDSHHYPVWIKKGIILGGMKGREEDGLKCLEFALAQDPYNEEAWYHKASILDQRMGMMDEAVLAYRSLLRINPKHVVGAFRLGLISYKRLNMVDKAKKYFDRVVDAAPDHKQAWLFKAEIANELEGDFSSAFEYMENARKHHPDDQGVIKKELELLMSRKKKFKKAVELAEKLNEMKPNDPVALYVSGLGALRIDDDAEEALKLMNSSIRADPKQKLPILSKANILAEYLNRAEDAVDLLKTAIRKNKDDPELWLELGINYFDFLYEPKEALKCFEKVTALDPNNSEGWYNKGMVQSRGFEKHQEALRSLDESTRIDDGNYLAWSEKGRILFRNYNMPDDALKCLNKAESINDNDPLILTMMAEIHSSRNNSTKAEELFNRAIEIEDIGDLDPFFGLAEMKLKMGDYISVQNTLNKALQTDPKNERVWMMKGNAFRKQGETGKALECYKRILRMNPDNQDALNHKTSVEAELERMK